MGEGEAAGVPDFSDRGKVEAWLRAQPREVSVVLAARAALRVLPVVGSVRDAVGDKFPALVTGVFRTSVAAMYLLEHRSEAVTVERIAAVNASYAGDCAFAISVGSGFTAAGVAATKAVGASRNAALAAAANADQAAFFSADALASVARAYAAAAKTDSAGDIASYAASEDAGAQATDAAADDAESDASAIAVGHSLSALRRSSLWKGAQTPAWAAKSWSILRNSINSAEGWQVWIDWYEARLRGDPYDEALEECYVLIPEEIWAQGPAAANAEIARRITELRRARHVEMLERIAALEARLAAQEKRGPVGMGHNHPPEPLDDFQPALEVLQSQSGDAPDLAASRAATKRLREALSTLTGYAGAKLDLFIDEAVKSCGKAGGVAIVAIAGAHYAGWIAELSAVIEAAAKWLATFPP